MILYLWSIESQKHILILKSSVYVPNSNEQRFPSLPILWRDTKKLSRADKLRFYNIAQGSLEECRYYIILSKDLDYIDEVNYNILTSAVEETSRTLNAYCKGVIDNDFSNEL